MSTKMAGDPAKKPAGLLSPSAMEPPAASPPEAAIPIAMDDRTLEALRGSIAKWEKVVAGLDGDRGIHNCPLCKTFYWRHCEGCPVAEATGMNLCDGSPYVDWSESAYTRYIDDLGRVPVDEIGVRLAQAELDFLKSLLPAQAIEAERSRPGTGLGAEHEHAGEAE